MSSFRDFTLLLWAGSPDRSCLSPTITHIFKSGWRRWNVSNAPTRQILVEDTGTLEHMTHAIPAFLFTHTWHIPTTNVLVEVAGLVEHTIHLRHTRRIPSRVSISSNCYFLVPMSLSKANARLNIPPIFVTLDVSHLPMSWLKTSAVPNIWTIFVTFDVSQLPMSWSKASAWSNI